MPDSTENRPLIRWLLGIASAVLISVIVGGSSLILKMDKAMAVQQIEINAIKDGIDDIKGNLKEVSTNSTNLTRLDGRVGRVEEKVEDVTEAIADVKNTVQIGLRNLEDQVQDQKRRP